MKTCQGPLHVCLGLINLIPYNMINAIFIFLILRWSFTMLSPKVGPKLLDSTELPASVIQIALASKQVIATVLG